SGAGSDAGAGAYYLPIIRAWFDRPIDEATATTANFTVTSGGPSVPGKVVLDAAEGTIALIPGSALTAGKDYTATLTTGIADTAGNHLAASYTRPFHTLAPGSVAWNPTKLNFGDVKVGTMAPLQKVSLVNASAHDLPLGTASLSGPDAAEFAIVKDG